MPRAEYWHSEAGGAIRCDLCPHRCSIKEGHSGICRVRRSEAGELALPFYGLLTALALDPIEKKPLHHFLPGSHVLSAGFVGCNMRCPFCQNWQISQSVPSASSAFSEGVRHTPQSLVAAARESGSRSIAYTYSEPTIHFEFIRDTMELATAAGLKNVLVTNGCLDPEPARELLAHTDAANVDLKDWSADAYAKTLGGDKESVLEFIRIASSLTHLEVTTLVVPGLSDAPGDMESIASFIAGLSPDIPLHLSAYHPAWKHTAPPTSQTALSELVRIARAKLRYVYTGNVLDGLADTLCPACGSVAISRRGYRIDTSGLVVTGAKASCIRCGANLPIVA